MARLAHVIAVGVPHHVTQRGNARRFILQEESDRKVYLDLLRESTDFHGIAVVGYCLMTNHVHLIAIPAKGDVLARALKETHGRFASYWNAVHHSTGHVWQGRYYSCPLDEPHLWEALRYTELNPVVPLWSRERSAGTGPVRLLIAVRTQQEHGWRCTCGVVDGPLSIGVHIWMQA